MSGWGKLRRETIDLSKKKSEKAIKRKDIKLGMLLTPHLVAPSQASTVIHGKTFSSIDEAQQLHPSAVTC
jgi:hypothetical protein